MHAHAVAAAGGAPPPPPPPPQRRSARQQPGRDQQRLQQPRPAQPGWQQQQGTAQTPPPSQQQQQGPPQRRPPQPSSRPPQQGARRPPPGEGWQQQQPQPQQQRGASPLVVVEGVNDLRAVRRAAPGADVFVLGTSTGAVDPRTMQELEAAAARYPGGLLLLLDPDVAGRQARLALDERFPGRCRHAFVAAPLATAAADSRWHAAGNVGVEHAPPGAIRAALAAPRRSDPQRAAFAREDLQRLGLVAEGHQRGGEVTARRTLVCACLGLGDCDGKQLLRQLNRYGFMQQDLAAALAWAERQLAAAPR